MSQALAIPYHFCSRCGRHRRGFRCRCDAPLNPELHRAMDACCGLNRDDLFAGGLLIRLGEILEDPRLQAVGVYIAGLSWNRAFGITVDDIAEALRDKDRLASKEGP